MCAFVTLCHTISRLFPERNKKNEITRYNFDKFCDTVTSGLITRVISWLFYSTPVKSIYTYERKLMEYKTRTFYAPNKFSCYIICQKPAPFVLFLELFKWASRNKSLFLFGYILDCKNVRRMNAVKHQII